MPFNQLAASIINLSYDIYEVSITPPTTGLRHLDRWDALGLEQIDEAFVTVFGEFKDSDIQIGTNTELYKTALSDYSGHCVNAGKAVQARCGQSGTTTFLTEIKNALAWGRLSDKHMYPLPFPTRSFILWIFALFKSISHAVREASLLIQSCFFISRGSESWTSARNWAARAPMLIVHIRADNIFYAYVLSVCADPNH